MAWALDFAILAFVKLRRVQQFAVDRRGLPSRPAAGMHLEHSARQFI